MASKRTLNRREFLGVAGAAAAASTITVLPRRVLGGPGFVAPSDKINLALIGSGTMGINLLVGEWLTNENLHISCVCDPNTDSTDYRDWSAHGIRNRVRRFLDQPNWGENDQGIRAGREVGREIIEAHYARARGTNGYEGCITYIDFRDLLEQETDLDGVLIMTPDHLHATIAIAAMNKGLHAISHKTLSNVLYEVRLAAETAEKTGVVSHLMAWNNDPDFYNLQDWIRGGVIGPIREVHNWTNRPVWPQGWLDPLPEQPVPGGLRWDLWLGPVPDMPYNLNYTHALFRGWYDFGAGCMGDMGNYSLSRVYRILDPGPPSVIEATAATGAMVIDGNVSRWRRSQVAFPDAATIRFRHPARGTRPPLDIWWYSGGMKPPTCDELYEDGQSYPPEGMLFVGEYGKILGDFHGRNFRLLPDKRMKAFEGMFETKEREVVGPPDEWINAIKEGKQSRGSFQNFQDLAEATCLGNLAIRMGQRLEWDAETMTVTNLAAANQYLRREYRPGWAL